jgi:hypothetical protein
MNEEHGLDCKCDDGFCRLHRGLCPRCGNEPMGKVGTFGPKCDLPIINRERTKRNIPTLTMEEYVKMDL